MNAGRLLALDTPTALKQNAVQGSAWDIVVEPLIEALDALNGKPGVTYIGLLGDHLHAITSPGAHTGESLTAMLAQAGFSQAVVEPAEITLEDVFTELAARQPAG
jgi:ABC-2 type transport system ATP-binding protein